LCRHAGIGSSGDYRERQGPACRDQTVFQQRERGPETDTTFPAHVSHEVPCERQAAGKRHNKQKPSSWFGIVASNECSVSYLSVFREEEAVFSSGVTPNENSRKRSPCVLAAWLKETLKQQ
jgi:hypothetical protein